MTGGAEWDIDRDLAVVQYEEKRPSTRLPPHRLDTVGHLGGGLDTRVCAGHLQQTFHRPGVWSRAEVVRSAWTGRVTSDGRTSGQLRAAERGDRLRPGE